MTEPVRAEKISDSPERELYMFNGQTYEKKKAFGTGGCISCVGGGDNALCNALFTAQCSHKYIFIEADVRPIETTPQPLVGRKDDTGKTQYSLVPPYALQAVANLLTDGLKKYQERDNWHKVDNAQERYLDALLRHLEAFRRGEDRDPEAVNKDTLHLTAVAVNALFLIEFLLNPKFQDNPAITKLPEVETE